MPYSVSMLVWDTKWSEITRSITVILDHCSDADDARGQAAQLYDVAKFTKVLQVKSGK